jgi:hypothetical protein
MNVTVQPDSTEMENKMVPDVKMLMNVSNVCITAVHNLFVIITRVDLVALVEQVLPVTLLPSNVKRVNQVSIRKNIF